MCFKQCFTKLQIIVSILCLTSCLLSFIYSYAISLLRLGTELLKFQKYAKKIYKTTRFNIQKDLWELMYPKHFVNTLLIHHIGSNRENEILYMATVMRHGLATSLLKESCIDNPNALLDKWEYLITLKESEKSLKSTKTNVISDIFQPFKNDGGATIVPKFILIEGAPGMGKTTMCKEIAYQWSINSLLKDSGLLFVIYLRDPAVSRRIKHLKDLVHYIYSFDDGAIELSKLCGKILNERESGDLTIVLDGYDEFDLSDDSLIVKILNREVLPQCRIIVTSRPSASYRLHSIADVRIEVSGFTDERKIEYIEQELKNQPDKINELQSYLKNNPSLNSLCYMPMMLTILLYVFKEKGCLPHNPTELYSKFVALIISHHLQKKEKSQETFVSLQSLPDKYNKLLLSLSKLAYFTLHNNQKVFSMEDVQKLCPNLALTSTDLGSLGIINLVQYFSSDKGKVDVFTFLHLSIHEYLAAYYVSSIDQDLQLCSLESTFTNAMYQETWNMFTAMNHDSWLLFQNYSIHCNNKYHQDLSNWISDVKSSSFLKCFIKLYNIMNAKSTSSNVVQFLFYNRNVKINQKHIYLSFCSRESGHQIEIKLFVIDEVLEDWFELFQMISVIANFSLEFSVDQLILLDRANKRQIFYCFQRKTLITHICLANCHISKGIIDAMNFPILQYLQIVNCTFEHGVLVKLANYLSNIFTLSVITIQNNKLSADNNLHSSAIVILKALSKLSSLKELDLQATQLSDDTGEYLSDIILNNANLVCLILNDNHLGKGMFQIVKALQQLGSLETLALGNTNMPNGICDDLALAIRCNPCLSNLNLNNNNLRSSSVTILLQALSKISTLKVLNLQSNQLSEHAGEYISAVILKNDGLCELNLDCNNIGKGVFHIAKALQKCTSLTLLGLGNNNFPAEVCHELSLAIQSNQNLVSLRLFCNNLKLNVLQSMTKVSNLKCLSLQNTQLFQQTGLCLSSIILQNTGLIHLDLSDNHLGDGALHVIQAMQCLTQLKILNLSNIKLTLSKKTSEDLGKALLCGLMNNTNLVNVNLSNNNIGTIAIQVAKGLQHISSLKLLNLSNCNLPKEICNELAHVIASNIHVEELLLSNNYDWCSSTIIIFLQALSKISTLKVLDLQGNQITEEAGEHLASILFNNPNLEQIILNDNNISKGMFYIAKALQKCTSLTFLDLGNNNFPAEVCHELSLAIQSNQHLVSLALFSNNLKLNILQSMTKISNLKVLSLKNTQLFQQAGEYLSSIILQNTGLICLDLSDNHLGSGALHVIQAMQCLTQLKILNLSNIKLTLSKKLSEDCGKALLCGLMNNTNLENVNLSNNNIGPIAIQVAKGLQHISSLKSLNLRNCNLPKEICDELAYVITSNKYVEELLLSNTSSTTITFLQALSKTSTLKVLDLQGNKLTEEAGEHLASILFNNPNLKHIYLNDNNIGKGMFQIAKALQQHSSLEILALGSTNMSREVCDDLALAIECNPCLNNLHLNDNNLQSSSINIILRALSKVSTLRVLNLQSNQLKENAVDYLSTALLNNTRLEQLLLHDNNIGKGTLHIAKALQQLNSLKVLTLGNTSISKEVSNELALAIKQNHCFETLNLISCDLQTSAIIILDALTKITSLKMLNLQGNHMNEEVGKFIASAIYHNSGLRHLCISYNNINKGMTCIVKALQQSLNLQELYLSNTNIPLELCNELAKAIKCNEHLEILCLDGNNFRNSVIFILLLISNIKTFDFFGTTVSEMASICLAAIIKKSNKLERLSINLPMEPLRIINALQNLSTLKTLVFDSASISNVTEVQLASVIIKNKSLGFLSLSNVNLSKHIIPQAIAAISNLTQLCLEEALLLEEISEDLALAISRNVSLEKLIIQDNMLQNGLIKVANECNKLSNIKVLQLAHNCIIPSKAVELTSIITQNTSLEGVLLGGITLNAAECFHFNINAVLNKREMTTCNTTNPVISNQCTFLEVVYLEMLRKQIDNDRKCFSIHPICLNAKNFVFVQKLWRYFQCCDNINQLRTCAFQQIVALDAKKMISSLHILEKVKSIDLENNNVDEDASLKLATALYSNNVLEQLWLRGNKLNTAGALYTLNSLKYLTTLQALDLSYNNIGSESADGIAAVIDNNPLMNQLWLDGNDLYSTGIIVICNALKKIRTLSILSLCNNGITNDAADELFAVITHNVLLEDLLLSNNQLEYTGITIIAESLSKLIKLRKLDLFNNNISRQGASSLAVVLQNSTSLQDLFLSGNNLETSGALKLCNALSHINSLHVLTLSNNNISDEVTSQLIEVLNNNHLYALLIGGNGLECGALKIAQVIENNNIAMQLLDFSNNNISEHDKEKIEVVFSKRKNFKFYV